MAFHSHLILLTIVYGLLAFIYLLLGVHSRKKLHKAVLKCLPIALLVGLVVWTQTYTWPIHGGNESGSDIAWRHQLLLWGLVLSGLGDVCLTAPSSFVGVFGILFFAVAQCVYVVLFGLNLQMLVELPYVGLLSGGVVFMMSLSILLLFGWHFHTFLKSGDHGMRRRFLMLVMPLVLVYFVLISVMFWSALIRLQNRMDLASLLGAGGALLFYVSDILIAAGAIWQLRVLLQGRILVMVTYYGAQYLITLSVLL